jgi:predicted DNA-binding WGR domain protein
LSQQQAEMKRYFESAHGFWELRCNGMTIVSRWGDLGTSGTKVRQKFDSISEAKRQYALRLRRFAKRSRGWTERQRPSKRKPPPRPTVTPSLLAKLREAAAHLGREGRKQAEDSDDWRETRGKRELANQYWTGMGHEKIFHGFLERLGIAGDPRVRKIASRTIYVRAMMKGGRNKGVFSIAGIRLSV